MGQVFTARDTRLERDVAIKLVESSDSDATTLERFRREAVATAGLSDPHVVSIYDAGFDAEDAYIVMEKLTGPSLAERIKAEDHLSVPDTLEVALGVTQGLMAAHKVGVIHRDIKPGNVMFHEGTVKIVDFGIAQLGQQHGAALTAPATAMGTAAYMSPEQAMGKQATEKSDWYALGCLLMAALTGTPPFRGEAIAVAQQQINADPPRASQLRTGVPPALDDLIDRLLAKDPQQRPDGPAILQQVKALRVDPDAATMLMPATTAQQTRVMPAAAPEEEYVEIEEDDFDELAPYDDRQRRRGGAGWVIALLLVLLLLGLGAWLIFGRGEGRPVEPDGTASPSAIQEPTEEQQDEPTQEPTEAEPTEEPTQEPTGGRPKNPFPTEFPKLPGQGDGSGEGDGSDEGDDSGEGEGSDDGEDSDQGEDDGESSTANETKEQAKKREKIAEAISKVENSSAREQLQESLDEREMTTAGLAQFRLKVESMRFSGDLTAKEADKIVDRL